ncbi:MAG: 3-deoxy-manno-octulosonate cytidylyltransferase [Saprospiraceae bacterium]|nr:3-deoxy-manno-octulosonate cytidylyltransferase [Saprospiraceae bacterium]
MKTIGIIPARFGSNRLPGKPLIDLHGKSLVQRVYEQVQKARRIDFVLVATDDIRIVDHVLGFGGKAVLTSPDHISGTDRIAEAFQGAQGEFSDAEIIVNIQGDEPFIDPHNLDALVESMLSNPDIPIATLVCSIPDAARLFDPNTVKAVLDNTGKALYFSRQAIPYLRGQAKEKWLQLQPFYQHVGVYGFRSGTLADVVKLPVSDLEKAESLEQLRWLSNGYSIQTIQVVDPGFGIDTPEDLERARIILKDNL